MYYSGFHVTLQLLAAKFISKSGSKLRTSQLNKFITLKSRCCKLQHVFSQVEMMFGIIAFTLKYAVCLILEYAVVCNI